MPAQALMQATAGGDAGPESRSEKTEIHDHRSFVSRGGGLVLIPRTTADWRDVPLSELKGATLDGPRSWFMATHHYAVQHGWLSGFPNLFHAEKDGQVVCGSIFIKFGAGSLRDVFLEFGPR